MSEAGLGVAASASACLRQLELSGWAASTCGKCPAQPHDDATPVAVSFSRTFATPRQEITIVLQPKSKNRTGNIPAFRSFGSAGAWRPAGSQKHTPRQPCRGLLGSLFYCRFIAHSLGFHWLRLAKASEPGSYARFSSRALNRCRIDTGNSESIHHRGGSAWQGGSASRSNCLQSLLIIYTRVFASSTPMFMLASASRAASCYFLNTDRCR
jgi:hypothetical protein